jgi:hypothetical protein
MLQLAVNSILAGDTAKAVQVVDSNWESFIKYPRAVGSFGAIMVSAGRLSDAEKIYSRYLQDGGDDFKIMHDIALINLQLGDRGKAIHYFDLSYKKKNEPDIKQELPFYLDIIQDGFYEMAEAGLRRILLNVPADKKESVGILIDALSANQYRNADSLANRIRGSLQAAR